MHIDYIAQPDTQLGNVLSNMLDANSPASSIIFVSANHTQHGNTILTTPETLDPSKRIRMRLDEPPNPDSMYAVSKPRLRHVQGKELLGSFSCFILCRIMR